MKSLREVIFLKNHPEKPLSEFQQAMYNELLVQLASSELREQIVHVKDGQTMDIWNDGAEYGNNFDDRELAGKIMRVWVRIRSAMQSPNS